jgi:hypothetical protein
VVFPKGEDANSYYLGTNASPEALGSVLRASRWLGKENGPVEAPSIQRSLAASESVSEFRVQATKAVEPEPAPVEEAADHPEPIEAQPTVEPHPYQSHCRHCLPRPSRRHRHPNPKPRSKTTKS